LKDKEEGEGDKGGLINSLLHLLLQSLSFSGIISTVVFSLGYRILS